MDGEYEEKYKSARSNFPNACADDCNPLLMPTMSRRRIILEWFRQTLWPTNLKKSGLTATKSKLVDAPIINEFPICMECEFIEYQYKTREEFENNANINGKLLKDIWNEVSFAAFIFCE